MNKLPELRPAVIQHAQTGEVLMVAYQSEEALEKTIASGEVWFYSRSRQCLWHKGETSGNRLLVRGIHEDCDRDTLLIKVVPLGPACHTGQTSCFFNTLQRDEGVIFSTLSLLEDVIRQRSQEAQQIEDDQASVSYTIDLLRQGEDKIIQKVGEEAVEVLIAGKNSSLEGISQEMADLVYHLTVLLQYKGLGWSDVWSVLEERRTKK